jgi:hypothetical protein
MAQTKLLKLAGAILGCLPLLFCSQGTARAGKVLIVADQMPEMDVLVKVLKNHANITPDVVKQEDTPASISQYPTVIVYIHHELSEKVERELLAYLNDGGKLLLLHHSISQGKGANKFWFPTLGMRLTPGDPEAGFYKWINPVTYTVVNLAPGNYITSHKVTYEGKTAYKSSDLGTLEAEYPSFTLNTSEVFINHVFTDGKDKTILLGFRWQDPKTNKVWMQDRAGWYKKVGKGWVIYLQPGHAATDFESGSYSQIVINAIDVNLKK